MAALLFMTDMKYLASDVVLKAYDSCSTSLRVSQKLGLGLKPGMLAGDPTPFACMHTHFMNPFTVIVKLDQDILQEAIRKLQYASMAIFMLTYAIAINSVIGACKQTQ